MYWDGRCWSYPVRLGKEAKESFQMQEGRDWSKKLHPSIPDANPYVAHALVGPEKSGRGMNWTIGEHAEDEAKPGKDFVVRLLLGEDGRPERVDWVVVYPRIPLSEYKGDPNFWYINPRFPGLQAIHKDPWIFICEDVLPQRVCEELIAKTETSLVPWTTRHDRTSADVCLPYDEVPGVQSRLADLLNMPVSHFEPLKVAKYQRLQYFSRHHDALKGASAEGFPTVGGATPFCNRVVTCFVYLQDSMRGGETQFDYGIKVRPRRGLAVIHFPGFMDTALDPAVRGTRDERTIHESLPAVDDKYICAQWGWTTPLNRQQALRHTGAQRCSKTTL